MFCSNCGSKLHEGSKFCNHCGVPLVVVSQTKADSLEERMNTSTGMSAEAEAATALEPAFNGLEAGDDPATNDDAATAGLPAQPVVRQRVRLLTWLLPAASLIVVGALIGVIYEYQMSVNRDVARLLQQGEKLALDGKLAEGKATIEEALRKRPDHRVLLADRALLADAINLQGRLSDTDGQWKNKKFDEAIEAIDKVKSELTSRSGPVFEKLTAASDAKREQILVAQVGDGIKPEKTVEELIPLLNTVKDFKSAEAQKTTKQITQRIVDISYDKASSELTDKQFADALSTIEDALKFDEANMKLTTLKTTVEQKKKAFEDAENSRIQKAIEAATQEDIKNRTQAVELLSIDAYTDQEGYFVVEGSVKNRATRSISYVLVYFDILDEAGNTVNQGSVYVSPNFLDVGDTGSFYTMNYNYGSMNSVNVTRVEWMLN